MKPGKLIAILLVLSAVLALAWRAGGETDTFILENADDSATLSLTGSPTLSGLIGAVLPRFTLEFADSSRTRLLTTPPAALDTLIDNLLPRVIVEFGDSSDFHSLLYPIGLIGDNTPPQQTNAGVSSGSGGIVFSWATNEPAIGTLKYGFQPGALNLSKSETLFATQHAITISGVNPGQTVYYRLVSVDRSGNTAQSAEQSYRVAQGTKLFLPSVIR